MPSVRPKSFALELPPDKAFGGVFFLERLMYICMSVSILYIYMIYCIYIYHTYYVYMYT